MLRSIGFALALMLCLCGWSVAQAAPPSITPLRELATGWKLKNLSKLHRATPVQLGILGEVDEISLKVLGWPFSFLGGLGGGVGACKYLNWPCDNNSAKVKHAD